MKEIALSQGKVAIVDDQDYDAVSEHRWCAHRNGRTFYAERGVYQPAGKLLLHEKMHRIILARKLGRPLVNGMHTDHVNGDGLDNRRENLCEVSCAQNNRNCRRRAAHPSSQYLGVSWRNDTKKWRAYVTVNDKLANLGYHNDELAAAQAREVYVMAHPELNARLNFPSKGATP